MTTAVIDIGTNTLLLLIVDDAMHAIVDLARFGRLGKGLDASGSLDAGAVANSLAICREYAAEMTKHGVTTRAVIATQAMREAANAKDFIEPAQQILGATIEVIAGEREAELAAASVRGALPELAAVRHLVVDVGGGSTEIIDVDGGELRRAVSLKIGAVRLTERHLKSDPPTAEELAALDADIDARLADAPIEAGAIVVGVAGTATTLAAVHLGLAHYDRDKVTGTRLTPGQVADLAARIARASVAERNAMPGMEPQRADVIAGGAAIFARIVAKAGAPEMIVVDRGIRWALAAELSSGGRAGGSQPT